MRYLKLLLITALMPLAVIAQVSVDGITQVDTSGQLSESITNGVMNNAVTNGHARFTEVVSATNRATIVAAADVVASTNGIVHITNDLVSTLEIVNNQWTTNWSINGTNWMTAQLESGQVTNVETVVWTNSLRTPIIIAVP